MLVGKALAEAGGIGQASRPFGPDRTAGGGRAVDEDVRARGVHEKISPEASFVDGGAVVRNCRMSKSVTELALLRRANEATKAALRAAADHTLDR